MEKLLVIACTKCWQEKTLDSFWPDKQNTLRYNKASWCKECNNIRVKNKSKTKIGLLTKIYSKQKTISKIRNHQPPTYTKIELSEWFWKQINANEIYKTRKESWYLKELIPSVDRLDNNKWYSLNNIQLLTWKENESKQHKEIKNWTTVWYYKKVIQLTLEWTIINEYHSASYAARENWLTTWNITSVCRWASKTAWGFMWKYKTEKRLLVVADLHWLNVWKKLIAKYNPDLTIFLGDYVDSFDVPDNDMINNLIDLIQYKKDNPDDTVLLLGNHDIQYIYEWNNCSWKRTRLAGRLKGLYEQNLKLFKIAHQEWDWFFTHAWVSKWWHKEYKKQIQHYWKTLEQSINNIFDSKDRDILFNAWKERQWYANNWWPLWSDMSEPKLWIQQMVGHTPVIHSELIHTTTYCDTLEHWDWIPVVLNI